MMNKSLARYFDDTKRMDSRVFEVCEVKKNDLIFAFCKGIYFRGAPWS